MVVSYFYYASVEKPNLPLAVRLVRNCTETFFPVFRVWVATSTTAGNVSSAFVVNPSLFSPEVDCNSSLSCSASILKWQNTSKYYYNFLNEFPSLSIYKTSFNFLLNIPSQLLVFYKLLVAASARVLMVRRQRLERCFCCVFLASLFVEDHF